MRKKSAGLVSLVLAAGLGTTLGVPAVSAAPAQTPTRSPGVAADTPAGERRAANPAEEKQPRTARAGHHRPAQRHQAKVEKRGASTVVKVGRPATARPVNGKGVRAAAPKSQDQYVELSREKTDKIFVDPGRVRRQAGPEVPRPGHRQATPGPTTFNGPLNNEIPAPDRSADNSTVWQPNYDRQHYQDLYFGQGGAAGSGGDTESVKQYFERQSSGRYSVDGYVSDWVKVTYNEARYGRSNGYPCARQRLPNTWDLVQDGVNQWVADQKAAGRTTADIKPSSSPSTSGTATTPTMTATSTSPTATSTTSRSCTPAATRPTATRSRARTPSGRTAGTRLPAAPARRPDNRDGGTQIGDTGMWVGDYTIQPENGGMSVFAHEYTHDLGLPGPLRHLAAARTASTSGR